MKHGVEGCGEDQAKAVNNVQSFEADGVFDSWLAWLFGFHLHKELDTKSRNRQEGGGDDLRDNSKRGDSKMRGILVPVGKRCIG